jgi:hypothetical protein
MTVVDPSWGECHIPFDESFSFVIRTEGPTRMAALFFKGNLVPANQVVGWEELKKDVTGQFVYIPYVSVMLLALTKLISFTEFVEDE